MVRQQVNFSIPGKFVSTKVYRLTSQVKSGIMVSLIDEVKKMRNEAIIEMIDELLDMDGPVMIGNLTFYKSDIVRRLDPVAYREMALDFVNSHIEDLEYDLERSDDEEEREAIKEQIAELEDFSV
jgi:hypothetical protein